MKRLLNRIKGFFFPPEGTPTWRRVLPYAVLGVLTLIVFVAAGAGWEYTNSPEFCGTQCHTMPPEYSSYLVSPHARVTCTECHIGRDFIATQVSRKAGDLRHVIYTVFQNYEYPIYAKGMRPARESCERCHFPEKFSDDSKREVKRFATDVENTPSSTYLIFKTGGGSERQGLGRGIHWHIENPVYFYTDDEREQYIPYIRVQNPDGTFEEYIDIESGFDLSSIDDEDLEEMDCMTCHNRITHLVNQPEDAIDDALARGLIDNTIPEIRLKAVEVLRAEYISEEQALEGIAGLEGYYKSVYLEYYLSNTETVQSAISTIQDIYTQSVYLEQESDWDTHANNIGHKDFPGCFRCHDGKHLNDDDEAVRLECNICHSIPVVAGPYDYVANLEISRGPEPQSHLDPNWIAQHHLIFDKTCENCHTTEDPGGVSNTSFCSNPACHGVSWDYAGFDAPALREIIQSQLPPPSESEVIIGEGPLTYDDTIGPLLEAHCGSCHGEDVIEGLNVTDYDSLMEGSVNGAVVVVGDPENSLLIIKITGDQPHFGNLSSDELEILTQWIQEGVAE
jgi:nitrate/TMAO reductase-like tetraheme cytochrome c subunit